MNKRLAAIALAALITVPLAAQVRNTERVQKNAWAMQRIAEVATSDRDMPRDLMHAMIEDSLSVLRGEAADGSYRWARYERNEAGRDTDRIALRGQGPQNPDSVEVSADLVYAMRIESPNRRLLVARNRRAYIDRIELDFRELGAFRRQEVISVGMWLEPGEGREYMLPEIARRATVKIVGWSDPEERGSAIIEVVWLHPELVDDAASPFRNSVATLKQLRSSVEERNREGTAQLASQLASQVGGVIPATAAAPRTDMVVETTASRLPLDRDGLLYELRTIEELMRNRGVSARGTAEERLRELIQRVEMLPLR